MAALDRCMKELSLATRESVGREELAESPLLEQLAQNLPDAIQAWEEEGANAAHGAADELLHLLRVLRNVCACGTIATTKLLDAGVHEQAAALVSKPGSTQMATVVAQLLANLAGAGNAEAAAVWGACWPETFEVMASEQPGRMRCPLHMILYNCCLASEALTAELCSSGSSRILEPILQLLSEPEADIDTHLEMLLGLLCIQAGRLPGLERGLSHPQVLPSLQQWHAGLLHVLSETFEDPATSDHLSKAETLRGDELASVILDLTDSLAQREVTHDAVSLGVLQVSFQCLRNLTSGDDAGSRIAAGRPTVSLLVTQHSMVTRLLSMLLALGPVQSRRPDKQQATVWPSNPDLLAGQYAASQPYNGYRTDIVAVLANIAYRKQHVQSEIQALGGVELILAHCQVDEESPLLREAALWAVRNLCEGNLSIQKQIEELQVVDTVETPELQQAGLQLQHDSATGKIKLIDAINE